MKKITAFLLLAVILLSSVFLFSCGTDKASITDGLKNPVIFKDPQHEIYFYLGSEEETVTDVITVFHFDSEEDAKTLYDLYTDPQYADMCEAAIDGSTFTMTYTPEYVTLFYGDRTRTEVIQSFIDNGYVQQ